MTFLSKSFAVDSLVQTTTLFLFFSFLPLVLFLCGYGLWFSIWAALSHKHWRQKPLLRYLGGAIGVICAELREDSTGVLLHGWF